MPNSASASASPTPSLLLTKRLTAFLSSNLSPQVHTAVLTTLSGKLLAHASPHAVGTLRTQCTVAASIWAQYATPASSLNAVEALPLLPLPLPPPHAADTIHSTPPVPSAVTIQLTGGVMVVRLLRCGLLFVCLGPAAAATGESGESGESGGNANANANTQGQGQGQGRPVPTTSATGDPQPTTPLGSPSEVESVLSVGAATTASVTTTASVAASAAVATRRQAEELARWLDDKLGSLGVLEEGLGIETR
ncbi:hypothetical protein M426DRAFT_316145 [Hypoxylon sp. CI-4A]|nr:hypothetical protein M426DRAFT_316145 [Hypoxylon sp. CI-4A]